MSVDTLVVGGGVDGLVAALTLAKAGRKVVVVEARDHVGGVAAGEEFHPGFRHAGTLPDSATFRPHVAKALGLEAHGLRFEASAPLWATDGKAGALIAADVAKCELPEADRKGFARMRAWQGRIRPFAAAVLDEAPPDVREDAPLWPLVKPAVGMRRLGRTDMMELLRVAPMSAEDWLREHLSDGPAAAALALPALRGTWMGPMSPTGTAYLLFRDALMTGQRVAGGPAALVAALERACGAAGVVLRTASPVERILVADGAVQGVALADATQLFVRNVLSTLGPRQTLLGLLDPDWLSPLARAEVEKVRVRGTIAVAHLALSGPLALGGRPGVEHAVVCASLVHAERAFDAAKNGVLPSWPTPLEVFVQGEAKSGSVATVLVYGVPYAPSGAWTDEARGALWEQVLTALTTADPGVRDRLVGHALLVPPDLEARFGLDGGHLHRAEDALDQLWSLRPTPGLSSYRGPVAGLFLGSRGQHPGMGLTGVPGALAARAVLGR